VNITPIDKTTDLVPALPITQVPTWDGAVWVGGIDLAELGGVSAYRLRDSGGYRTARLMVRDGPEVLGFVAVAVQAGHVDADEVHRAVRRLPRATWPPVDRQVPHNRITVVVCTRDRVEMLQVALASILDLDYPGLAVVVVDNASRTDATRRYIAGLADPRVRLVVEALPGLSRARNAGLRAAETDIVAFTDDDVVVDRHWLRGLADGFSRGRAVACVSGIVPTGEIRTPAQAYFDQRVGWASACKPRVYQLGSPPADVPLFPFQVGIYGTGANFAVRRNAMFELGGFDEALGAGAPTDGGEDIDMFFRVLRAGWQLAYEPSAVVWHRHRADNEALALQARGYGLGLGAWMTKIALDRRTAWLALRTAVTKAPNVIRLSYRTAKVVASPPTQLACQLPTGVGMIELMSVLKGPLAYRAARREGRRAAPLKGRLR
jgi:GT2 family glycosyltransferase